ncbi:MAG: UDP-N-acetylmuramoyl-L-alanine--D-glutamate ligase [Acidimicrobiales bacterium]
MTGREVPARALVVGLAVTGQAVVRQLQARGHTVTVADDRPSDLARGFAAGAGLELIEAPAAGSWDALVRRHDVVLPSPGVPAHHPVFAAATVAGVPVWSEFELATRWSEVPIAAITGTNGKTTVTVLVTEMLERSGKKTVAAGNTDLPLVDALDRGLDVIVVEASSFRLQLTETFAPRVGTWLNLAEDHLDWHPSMADYTAAKAKIWARQGAGDVAIANADDPVVAEHGRRAPASVQWFSIAGPVAGWWWDHQRNTLVGPAGSFADVTRLSRRLPHDLSNALAATATAVAAGARVEACAAVLADFHGLAHRVALIADAGGVRWYDDSKATTPASVLAAVRGFDSVVLIAGGRNKGLDLSVLGAAVPPVRAVVAIGDAATDVEAAFEGAGVEVRIAATMAEAVTRAGELSRPGDAVLLSPGCASFDWYRDYTARGDDFARLVVEHTGASPAPALPTGGTH